MKLYLVMNRVIFLLFKKEDNFDVSMWFLAHLHSRRKKTVARMSITAQKPRSDCHQVLKGPSGRCSAAR